MCGRPIRYHPLEYTTYKELQRQLKYDKAGKRRPRHNEDSPSSSETSDDDNEHYYEEEKMSHFWNETELVKM